MSYSTQYKVNESAMSDVKWGTQGVTAQLNVLRQKKTWISIWSIK